MQPPNKMRRRISILIVEDNKVNQKVKTITHSICHICPPIIRYHIDVSVCIVMSHVMSYVSRDVTCNILHDVTCDIVVERVDAKDDRY
jgi:hypothetical protein